MIAGLPQFDCRQLQLSAWQLTSGRLGLEAVEEGVHVSAVFRTRQRPTVLEVVAATLDPSDSFGARDEVCAGCLRQLRPKLKNAIRCPGCHEASIHTRQGLMRQRETRQQGSKYPPSLINRIASASVTA